jgi:uncharacterized protein (TIGR03437 family)
MGQTPALLVLCSAVLLHAADTLRQIPAPSYSSASIVNAASNQPASIAPGSIATLYGTDLAFVTRAITGDDLHGLQLPLTLPGTGLRIAVGGLAASLYYVSPTQVNFLLPASLLPGPADITLTLDGRAGPVVRIALASAAPALFQADAVFAIATRVDGSLITKDTPAKAGDIVILYATGLGRVKPDWIDSEIATTAAVLREIAAFRVTLAGTAVDAAAILYAGVTPGFAGLYQINLRLPATLPRNPEIRIGFDGQMSPEGLALPVF